MKPSFPRKDRTVSTVPRAMAPACSARSSKERGARVVAESTGARHSERQNRDTKTRDMPFRTVCPVSSQACGAFPPVYKPRELCAVQPLFAGCLLNLGRKQAAVMVAAGVGEEEVPQQEQSSDEQPFGRKEYVHQQDVQ